MQLQLPNPGRAIRRRATATREAFSSVEGFKKGERVTKHSSTTSRIATERDYGQEKDARWVESTADAGT